ncbi:unnamed protein product [Rhizoctonia solani]|uniref:PSP proline-rich domain-containing protein n=1 Tax=Rhizoctonia solani TaxID=456999 RepID=A0A8H2ZWF6_9AGAM|nr:unnamed protein product [Rhizoctonia solani]
MEVATHMDETGMGSHEPQHMDVEFPKILEDDLFFYDASALTAWPTQVTQYTTLECASTLGVSQDASLADEEPPYDPEAEYVQPGVKQCFNCMATTHIVSDCPHKRDPQHVSLARADYGSRGGNTTRPMRLHEAEEVFKRRTKFAQSFEPGYIQGELLRASLGLNEYYGGGNEDLPWHYTMCDWGYPPGWVSDTDPRIRIMERINSTSQYQPNEGFPSLMIFDGQPEPPTLLGTCLETTESKSSTAPVRKSPPDSSDLQQSHLKHSLPDELPSPPPPDFLPPPPNEPHPASPPPPNSLPYPPRRWVDYRTTLFQSERLPISLVSRPLPALSEAPPPPPSSSPPAPPSTLPPLSPPPPPKELTEQEKRRLLWEQIVAANS